MIGIIMIVYQFVLLVLDFVHFVFRATLLTLQAAWRLVFPPPEKSVVGEIVLITGAGHGIGRELSLQLARLGAKIVCLDINEANNKKTVADICREGGAAFGYKCDVTNKDEVRAVSNEIRENVGEITILVNNAGIMPCKPFIKHTSEDIESIFRVNVFAHFWMLKEWLPTFIAIGRGHIVAMSSIAGLMATSNLVPYCASKYAVKGLMDGLQEEMRYGGRNPNIKFTCVHPFIVDTGLAKKPRIRFPSLTPVLTPETAAEAIISAVQHEQEEVVLPYQAALVHHAVRLLPREVMKVFLDFMDTGVDEHDS
ncbi:short-chain dehydrogenase/reductase family 16C member 6-like [Penaeus japonicus]|uniref:short-chain dehydrogenase/reductase family 16C member 6-like n=1 Tax=Penaeus japonicus TaxID=27405 RepID=UPI001C70C4BD|nr:short-chain dehydrogenase/reductase family 16C member 6-like [Penaeus japonicus]